MNNTEEYKCYMDYKKLLKKDKLYKKDIMNSFMFYLVF